MSKCLTSGMSALSKSGCWQDFIAAPRPTQRQKKWPVIVPEELLILVSSVSATGQIIPHTLHSQIVEATALRVSCKQYEHENVGKTPYCCTRTRTTR